jgi:hypothetical protein
MSTIRTPYDDPALGGEAVGRDARELLGQVMGFVAVTVAFAALGAYLGRDLSGATGLVLFVGAFACNFGLNAAVARGNEQLAVGCRQHLPGHLQRLPAAARPVRRRA